MKLYKLTCWSKARHYFLSAFMFSPFWLSDVIPSHILLSALSPSRHTDIPDPFFYLLLSSTRSKSFWHNLERNWNGYSLHSLISLFILFIQRDEWFVPVVVLNVVFHCVWKDLLLSSAVLMRVTWLGGIEWRGYKPSPGNRDEAAKSDTASIIFTLLFSFTLSASSDLGSSTPLIFSLSLSPPLIA